MRCPVCKFAKCRWIELKKPENVSLERLEQVVSHNLSYIDMIYSGHQGSAAGEERLLEALLPYTDEIDRRKARGAVI